MNKAKKKFLGIIPLSSIIIISLFGVSVIIFTGLIGAITFQQIAPTTNPFVTSDSTVNLSYGIHAGDGLSSITHSWNGTNYSLFDYRLKLFYNFQNNSDLGENDTIVKDLSLALNNGTISRNGSVSNTTLVAGKYGNAYEFYSYIGDKISFSPINLTTEGTIAFWWKWKQGATAEVVVLSNNNGYYSRILVANTGWTWSIESDTNGINILSSAPVFSRTGWRFIVITKNGNITKFYEDTNLTKTTEIATTNSLTLSTISAGDGNFFNGTIDNLMIWNRTLTQNEINYLYNLSLEKLNISYFEYNHTVSNNIYFNQPSFLCTTNFTNDNFCSATKTIRQSNIINCNFSTSIGTVNNNFYGMHTRGELGNNYYIDINNDTVLDTLSDSEWNRNAFLNSGQSVIRRTMELSNCMNDDYSVNTTDLVNSNLCNINSVKSELEWATLNNITILFVMNRVPYGLRNTTSGYCNSSVWSSCNVKETQYINFSLAVKNYLEYVGCNKYPLTCKVSVWNEPENMGFWLNNLSITSANAGIRSREYNNLYNISYQSVKAVNSSIEVGGAVTHINDNFAPIIWMNWLGNFSGEIDFFDFHTRSDVTQAVEGYSYSNITALYKLIEANLTSYGVNISKIYHSEYKYKNESVQNTFSLYPIWTSSLSNYLIDTLNYNASRYISIFYKWSSTNAYTVNQSEYPLNANTVLEPLLGGQFYPPYNVTKNFAHLCPAGATVYVSSNDASDSIKQLSCKKGNMYSLIVINTDTNSKNLTWDGTGTSASDVAYLMDIETGNLYLNNNTNQLGILNSYGIKYLSTPLLRMDETNGLTKIAPTDEEYTSFEINVSSKTIEDTKVTYHIASNLSISQNVLITLKPYTDYGSYCVNVEKVEYTPKGGSKTTWNNEEARATCYKLTTTGYTLEVSPSLSSNELVFTYGTGLSSPSNPFNSAFSFLWNIGGLLIIILLIGVIFIFMWAKQINIMQGVALIAGVILSAYILGIFLEAIA